MRVVRLEMHPRKSMTKTMTKTIDHHRGRDKLGKVHHSVCGKMEATMGFEPMNRGFADLRLRPLGYVAFGF